MWGHHGHNRNHFAEEMMEFMRGPRGFGRGHHHPHFHRGRGGRGAEDAGEHMMRRILGHGDLRYVILALLNEKPSHGYELIKALEEKSSGSYIPSPGVIYPTLTFLEEGGFATATSGDNKKLYTITDEGKRLLEENHDHVDEIFERMSSVGEKMSKLRDWFGKEDFHREGKDARHSLKRVMHQLKAELFAKMPISKERQEQITGILEKAIQQIRDLK